MPNTELKLRTLCQPEDEPKPGEHFHKCDSCSTVWKHDNSLATDPACSKEQFTEAHDCPSCGANQREKYWPGESYGESLLSLLFNGGL